MELFCFGQAGYGTYQQLLFIEEQLDKIEPDFILIQMCDNDFIDNYAALEYTSNYKVGVRRPYLDGNGELYYRIPIPSWKQVLGKSKFLDLLIKKLEVIFYDVNKVAQYQIAEGTSPYKPYEESKVITGQILDKMKTTFGDIPYLIYLVANADPYKKDLIKLCEERAMPYTMKPLDTLYLRDKERLDVRSSDGYHWTELGHRVVGEILVGEVENILKVAE